MDNPGNMSSALLASLMKTMVIQPFVNWDFCAAL